MILLTSLAFIGMSVTHASLYEKVSKVEQKTALSNEFGTSFLEGIGKVFVKIREDGKAQLTIDPNARGTEKPLIQSIVAPSLVTDLEDYTDEDKEVTLKLNDELRLVHLSAIDSTAARTDARLFSQLSILYKLKDKWEKAALGPIVRLEAKPEPALLPFELNHATDIDKSFGGYTLKKLENGSIEVVSILPTCHQEGGNDCVRRSNRYTVVPSLLHESSKANGAVVYALGDHALYLMAREDAKGGLALSVRFTAFENSGFKVIEQALRAVRP